MKKKILFINGHLNAGGCERSLVDILKHMDYEKYKVDLLLLECLGDYIDEVPEDVQVYLYSLNNAFGRLAAVLKSTIKNLDFFSFWTRVVYFLGEKINKKFLKLLRPLFKKLSNKYDIVVAFRPGMCTELAAYTFNAKKRISWWHHGEMNYKGKAAENLHLAYKKMSHVVAVSSGSAQLVINSFPDIKEKVCIISNMIDTKELIEKSTSNGVLEKSENYILTLVTVGRMSPEKNMTLCPEIGKVLKQNKIQYKWYLIGDGIEKSKIEDLIDKYDLKKEMILTGNSTNPYPYMVHADIMVHPSLVESQGITILEGMALGIPVIVVKSIGPSEFIVNGENGFLVSANAEIISNIIQKISLDETLKDKVVSNARVTVEEYRTIECMKKINKVLGD